MGKITQNVQKILRELPSGVQLVAVAKGRSLPEIQEALSAGATIIGENYVQETLVVQPETGHRARWHFIGHLQKNKVKSAVGIFDMIETVDSTELAVDIDKRCRQAGKIMPVLLEINSGRELHKSGVLPEAAIDLVKQIVILPNIKVQGLMTMGPATANVEAVRPWFKLTRQLFEDIKQRDFQEVEMKYLSMGMSDSYLIAIEEGANLVRIGRGIFG